MNKFDFHKPAENLETENKRAELNARGTRGESALGYWKTGNDGICRFTPVRLSALAAHVHDLTPNLDVFAPFSPIVKEQALFVLNRYLCGGVALRDSGQLTWPELLLVHARNPQTHAQAAPKSMALSAAERLFNQQCHFAQAQALLRGRSLTLEGLLAAQSCLCPDIPESGQGRLRWCDVWVHGSSVRDAQLVPIAAQELHKQVQQLINDINLATEMRQSPFAATTLNTERPSVQKYVSVVTGEVAAHIDIGFAAQITLLGLHPFTDGNGRVARVLFQALATHRNNAQDAALFAASTLLVTRVLQPRIWDQSLWRAQFGLEDANVFMAVCRQAAEIGMALSTTLLDGLQTAWFESGSVSSLDNWLPSCPLIRIDNSHYLNIRSDRWLTVPLSKNGLETGTIARAAIEFLLSFELALRDGVETP